MMSAPYLLTVWCDRCQRPLECPDHGAGIPVHGPGEDDVEFIGCPCTVPLCDCPAEVS
jgi:hypothetical protein